MPPRASLLLALKWFAYRLFCQKTNLWASSRFHVCGPLQNKGVEARIGAPNVPGLNGIHSDNKKSHFRGFVTLSKTYPLPFQGLSMKTLVWPINAEAAIPRAATTPKLLFVKLLTWRPVNGTQSYSLCFNIVSQQEKLSTCVTFSQHSKIHLCAHAVGDITWNRKRKTLLACVFGEHL